MLGAALGVMVGAIGLRALSCWTSVIRLICLFIMICGADKADQMSDGIESLYPTMKIKRP